ncbi:hypothetical protein SAMN05444413_11241 [Roseivivax marinus]|nr:hypothetical protein [Roseivivax marinus]SEL62689.1 hypothetical protein SAMN05444413_11241 [Roseivivax marinus]
MEYETFEEFAAGVPHFIEAYNRRGNPMLVRVTGMPIPSASVHIMGAL